MITKRIFSLCTVGLMLLLLVQSSFADFFYVVVDSFGRRARNAYLDVSTDILAGPGPVDIRFRLFNATNGGEIAQFSLTTNPNGFVSTSSFDNLFNLTGGQPSLIEAFTPQGSPSSGATLHVDSTGAPMIVGVLPAIRRDGTRLGMGTQFAIALGSFRSASLLIANVSGNDVYADVWVGTRGTDGGGIFSNPRLVPAAVWRVDLTQNQALSNLIVSSSGNTIVQAVIDDGKSIQSFMVTPTF